MDIKRPIKFLVVSVLVCYTAVMVYQGASKLREGKIGTLFRKISPVTVEGSALYISGNVALTMK